jgi:hypothetical protein
MQRDPPSATGAAPLFVVSPHLACLRMSASPLPREGLPGPALVGYMAGACVFRASVFREVGGYEPRLFIGGEEELVASASS